MDKKQKKPRQPLVLPPRVDPPQRLDAVVNAYASREIVQTDPLGSYTGISCDSWEIPVQDADDL